MSEHKLVACDHAGAFKPADTRRVQWGEQTFCPSCLCVLNPDGTVFMQFPESARKADVEAAIDQSSNGGPDES